MFDGSKNNYYFHHSKSAQSSESHEALLPRGAFSVIMTSVHSAENRLFFHMNQQSSHTPASTTRSQRFFATAASAATSIFRRFINLHRTGFPLMRHTFIIMLGTTIASAILIFSGHSPFMPEAAQANFFTAALLELVTLPANITQIGTAILVGFVAQTMGIVMSLFIFLAAAMASYDVTINTPEVIIAWKVLRDVTNLFFVIILLIIAIGTTLRREQYMWNKNLPRFIIAAIFVNFSRTIVAFATDFADVLQQTFVAGLNSVAFAKLFAGFGATQYLSLTTYTNPSLSTLALPLITLAAGVIAVILQLVVCAIMFVYFAMLLGRVGLLWLLAIFGAPAFAASVLPQTQKYYKDWWAKLSNAVALGPILAFFLWLAVTIVPDPNTASATFATVLSGSPESTGAASQPSFLIGFCLMVTILYYGMKMGTGMAGDIGSFVSKAQGFAFGTVLGGISGAATGAAAYAGGSALRRLDYGQMKGRQLIGKAMEGSTNTGIQNLGRLVGAGGTFGNLREAFKNREEEQRKRMAEKGLAANAAVATAVGTVPVLKVIELARGQSGVKGDALEKTNMANREAKDIMNGTDPVNDRVAKANKAIDDGLKKAEDGFASGALSQVEIDEARASAAENKAYVNDPAWQKIGRVEEQKKLLDQEDEKVATAGQRLAAGEITRPDFDTIKLDAELEKARIIGNMTRLGTGTDVGAAVAKLEAYKAEKANLDGSIAERRVKITNWDDERTRQLGIVANPATSAADRARANAEVTRLEGDLLAERAALVPEEARSNALGRSFIPGSERLATRMQDSWKGRGDALRAQDDTRITAAQRFSTGADMGFVGRALVNMQQEYGTQQYLDQKARLDAAVKDSERVTGSDPDNLVDYVLRAKAGGDAEKLQAGLMGLAKKGKLGNLTTSYRAAPVVTQLIKERAEAEGKTPAQVEQLVADVRRTPGDPAVTAIAMESMLKDVYNGDKTMVGKIMSNIRDADHEASGANPAATYTDSVTGATKLIEMKLNVDNSGKVTIDYDKQALKALNAELKGMKPGEIMWNLTSKKLFSKDADGNVQGIGPLAKFFLKAMPAELSKYVKNLNADVIQSIKEQQGEIERTIRDKPDEQQSKDWKRLLAAMKTAGHL